jgi:tetratricopeptide (TPR) repeat protein
MRPIRKKVLRAACLLLAAAAPPSVAAVPDRPSVQQQFDAASQALAAQRWADALTILEALEARLATGSPRSLALVRVRKAEALLGLGREAEAESALRLGLPAIPENDASLREDRYLGLVRLGEIAERALDYGEALKNYRAAMPLVDTVLARSRAVRGLVQTGMFYDAPGALADIDRALAQLAAEAPADKRIEGNFRIMKGRVLLNMGRAKEARVELKRATELLGGLTLRVDASDLAARSDMAIAALLSGDTDEAREYMAWTGAGRLPEGFASAVDMPPPPCGDELSRDDVAVVEFSILDNGSIGHATPVYSSRQGPSALAFARAVAGWSWKPESLANIPTLLRTLTRVEMRCSTAASRPSAVGLLRGDLDSWLEARGQAPGEAEGRSQASRLKPLQDELARREATAGRDSPALLPILADLAGNPVVPREEKANYLERGLAIARREKAPAPVLAWFAIQIADPKSGWGDDYVRRQAEALRQVLAQPDIGSDPRAAAATRLQLAALLANGNKEQRAQVIPLLSAVRDTPGLGAQDDLRVAALARLASAQLAAGDETAARAAYAASGLDSDRCQVMDAEPRLSRRSGSSADFPNEALRWGFSGWAKIEFDISSEGATLGPRPVTVYPPFVFGPAAAKIVERYRYDPTFRPGGGLGCGGKTLTFQFRIQ